MNRILIRRSEEQLDYPIPVLLNLSSWQDERQSITDWLIAELKSKYGVSKSLGLKWIQNRAWFNRGEFQYIFLFSPILTSSLNHFSPQ